MADPFPKPPQPHYRLHQISRHVGAASTAILTTTPLTTTNTTPLTTTPLTTTTSTSHSMSPMSNRSTKLAPPRKVTPLAKSVVQDPNDAMDILLLDNFLTPKQRSLRLSIRQHMEIKVAPLITNLYEKAEFSNAIVELAKELGPAGLQIQGYGCPGFSNVDVVLLGMEMARVDASFATFYLVHSGLSMQSIAVAGNAKQKEYWLPRMATYEKIGAFALTEPNFGSHATGLETRAKPVPGGWILNGQKRWIGNATFADVIIVWARDTESDAIRGFIVEKGIKGLKTAKIENKIGLRIVQNADITLDDCYVPDSHCLSESGFSGSTQKVLESSRAVVASCCAGVLVGAYDNAMKYCRFREQFGKPLAGFQLVQDRLMRSLALAHGSILTVIHLSRLMDARKATMAQIALAKAFCSKSAREGVALCREVVGGNGICIESGVAKAFVDMEALYTYEGTYDVNQMLAGRLITGLNAFT